MDIDAIVKAALKYVMACGPIWDVEDCPAQEAFIAELRELDKQASLRSDPRNNGQRPS